MDRGSEKTLGVTIQSTKASQATQATQPILSGATRVRFRERQVLRATDLDAEQSYLMTAHRRHHIGQHGWGIVSGLELAETPEGLVMQPGVAIDGYGRELIVPLPLAIPPDVFTQLGNLQLRVITVIDVWLFYDLIKVNVPQRGSWDCGPDQNSRVRARASLRFTAASEGVARLPDDPRNPVEVPFADLPFLPHRMPPDDPAREWPVYLGTIRRDVTPRSDPNSQRPSATLVGEVVDSPSGRARMQVGSELRNDMRRFAVSVADPTGKLIDRLAIDREGNAVITGNTTVSKSTDAETACDLRLRENLSATPNPQTHSEEPLCPPPPGTDDGQTPGAARMMHFLPLAATPKVAAPWQIYRTSIQEGPRTIKQLRIEIGHPGDQGDPKLSKLVIGTRSGDNFSPCLTVSANCEVTIEGRLTVAGQLIKGAITANPSDPRFSDEIANQWVRGTLIAEEKLGTLFSGVNSGELSVRIVDSQEIDLDGRSFSPSQPLSFFFLVRNNSTSTITNIQLYVSASFRGDPVPVTLNAAQFSLIPGATRLVGTSPPFNPGGAEGVLNISVSALGVGPLPNVIAAARSASITIHEPVIG